MSDLSIVEQVDRDAAKPFFNEHGPGYRQLILAFARHRASEAERVREACAKVAEDAADEANRIALLHAEDSDSRGRMFARAREARSIAAAIRSLPIGEVE